MTQQFLKLYIVITISLITLVLCFGQLYNHLFAQQTPSITFNVSELSKIVADKDRKIIKLKQSDLILPDSLHQHFAEDGIITVNELGDEYIYIQSDDSAVYKVGPMTPHLPQTTNWLAFSSFYILLGGAILLFLRPVFRDLSLLQGAANRFSQKVTPIALKLKPRSSIAPLAASFEKMSERIVRFIQLHNDLSRIISHEIRTPLTRMRFALSISDLEDDQQHQIERDIAEIEQRLEQYLSFARLEYQHQGFNFSHVILNNLIHQEVNKFSLYDEYNFNLELDITDCFCEQKFIAIALQNLIVNAVKYAKRTIYIESYIQQGNYCIRVSDDGAGLPLNANALIEPFQQGDNNLASGYGLGLYIVKRIASWHKGHVTLANSARFHGAEVTLTWPIKNDI